MIQHQGIWLPDGETHLVDWMTRAGEIVDGKGTYQIKKLRAALQYVTNFNAAVDIGAHCGLWSMQLQKRFAVIHAFEPVAAHRECFTENVVWSTERPVYLRPCALGDHEGFVRMETAPTSSGDTRVAEENGDIPLRTLDSFALTGVGFMKLDCEGYELFALRGAKETIEGNHPVIIVEQKPGRGQRFGLGERDAVLFLEALGYRCAQEMSGDFIMVPE